MLNKTLALLLSLLLCSACTHTTRSLWGSRIQYGSFNETIDALFISEDDAALVFLGKNYHYIFAADPLFVHAYRYSAGKNIRYSAEDATLDTDTGKARVTLRMQLDRNPDDIRLLQELHALADATQTASGTLLPTLQRHTLQKNIAALQQALKQSGANQAPPLNLELLLYGTTYQASQEVNQAATRFAAPHKIRVWTTSSRRSSLPERIALTPVAIAADGVLTVGAVALAAVAITTLVILDPELKK